MRRRAVPLRGVARAGVLGLVGFTGCASVWQFNRYFEKVELMRTRSEVCCGPPTQRLPDQLPPRRAQLLWRSEETVLKVHLKGTWFNDMYVLVGPRTPLESSLGSLMCDAVYRVFVPLVLPDGRQVAVCKGQVPLDVGRDRAKLLQVLKSWGPADEVVGVVRTPEHTASDGRTSAEVHLKADSACINSLLSAFYRRFGVPEDARRPLPYFVEVLNHSSGASLPNTRSGEDFANLIEVTPDRHMSYAAFWFLSFCFGIVSLRNGGVV
eukprot:TRINITY_DN5088_c2_g1_i1.p1 TRINITY_DN5088_c2_g1~~TRINITY_DN5088_c2_g1_i1.p1  ORF type:complete len:266 (+),score=54.37 TRINITY_DN5088_c2_g1_i1:58-855(+)